MQATTLENIDSDYSLLSLSFTPQGHLKVRTLTEDELGTTASLINDKRIANAFLRSQEEGLYQLVKATYNDNWSKTLIYWRNFISGYIKALCYSSVDESLVNIPVPNDEDILKWQLDIPPMTGSEYVTQASLILIWQSFGNFISNKVIQEYTNISQFLAKELPTWQQVGRVCFHLAENKQDPNLPFAFMATYAESLTTKSNIKYKPLSVALKEYAGELNKQALTNLLRPINNAAKNCSWLAELIDGHDIYHPLAWTPQEAFQLLKSVSILEDAGLIVKLPNWWKKRANPKVQVTIGNNSSKKFTANELLNFDVSIVLDGENLTKQELDEIMASPSGVMMLRGEWVFVDKEKLNQAVQHWQQVQKQVGNNGISFIEGMRLLAGVNNQLAYDDIEEITEWHGVQAGDELKKILKYLREPSVVKNNFPKNLLQAELRDYQETGVAWLHLLTELGLGACLADDMGLGKTIQLIALLLLYKKNNSKNKPSILILPASLLANWKSEISKFAPSIKTLFVHASELSRSDFEKIIKNQATSLDEIDLVITTYSGLLRQDWLIDKDWGLVILDEAQAIKNPASRQTKLVKKLKGQARIALTGTPVENRLGDLWSIFDFICPGLLGSSRVFKNFIKSLEKSQQGSYTPLRNLVAPYILRRLKTDKNIINDLPDLTEVNAWCGLSKLQAKLYNQAVNDLAKSLQKVEEGIQRKGLVLAYLTKFKQICNHSSQFTGDNEYIEKNSGKFMRLREICEEIAARQEKVLVFTQYREITKFLQIFLAEIFGHTGLVLHGGTAVKNRKNLVDNFQSENGSPFFILSLKAGGTGLNLTAANHVIHFDRWWNPAVEKQATDRAYRIGQKKNVLVHKFVCKGTIEEKIDSLLQDKKILADNILQNSGEAILTEMNDNELLKLVALDIDKAII